MFIYIYMFRYIYICLDIYIYIYIHTPIPITYPHSPWAGAVLKVIREDEDGGEPLDVASAGDSHGNAYWIHTDFTVIFHQQPRGHTRTLSDP